ncbi:hypothetical protein LX86_001077 [Lentzea aerocolonigenes]|nr:hypothetical protein [Lentzea aerocolonigenes]
MPYWGELTAYPVHQFTAQRGHLLKRSGILSAAYFGAPSAFIEMPLPGLVGALGVSQSPSSPALGTFESPALQRGRPSVDVGDT